MTYPDSDIIFEMSVDYFDDADNVFQFDSIPFGTTYNDLVKAYGEPVYSSGDKYGGYYAWELTDNVELTVTTDEVKNNAKIMSVTVAYYNY